ncbi:hypothetical protein FIBSPDRAFT_906253 [Athelia psychrophila]|uniref:Uncharacterized protein n=1 Tax=Athelia psychrophila TaxID=1759441 RepID=A0A167SKA7_9AGAM|nr:hypothetical protein FIBSPDRAFT_906253 [Fibularhizoctonia sp. CBS 109695]
MGSDIERARVMNIHLRDLVSLEDGLLDKIPPIQSKSLVPQKKATKAKRKSKAAEPVIEKGKNDGSKATMNGGLRRSDRGKNLPPDDHHFENNPPTTTEPIKSRAPPNGTVGKDDDLPTWTERGVGVGVGVGVVHAVHYCGLVGLGNSISNHAAQCTAR